MGSSSAPSTSTKDRILDAAERLFAERGYEAASLREVTREAAANLAAVNYHFGSKVGLFRAVFERRVGAINRERLRRLDELEGEGEPGLEELLEAFLAPVLLAEREVGFELFLRIVGRSFSATGPHVEAIHSVFAEVQRRFVPGFARALPELSEEELFWRLHLLLGTFSSLLASPHRLAVLSKGRLSGGDPAEALKHLLAFAAGGMGAPAVAPWNRGRR